MIDYNGCRNITTREAKITKRETTRVPVLGAVSCGVPKFAEENIEEYTLLFLQRIQAVHMLLRHQSYRSV